MPEALHFAAASTSFAASFVHMTSSDKPQIGILFGGQSREREIAFAGGRTVYDNLDRARFEPVPIFIDSLGGLVQLDWQYIYKGTIRDFFPPAKAYPADSAGFQLYVEHLEGVAPYSETHLDLLSQIGQPLRLEDLPQQIDFAFLSLHGNYGEDGRIQGLLEWLEIPYSGCGIFPSAVGIDKLRQHQLQASRDHTTPKYLSASLETLDAGDLQARIADEVGFPCVIKHPTQGSSIGVQVVQSPDELPTAVEAVRFRQTIAHAAFQQQSPEEQHRLVSAITDIRSGIGLPVRLVADDHTRILRSPQALLQALRRASTDVLVEAVDAPSKILVEEFITGTEFSVIVLQDDDGQPVALPPTEIRKASNLYDYRAKYLPGIANKVTPIDLPDPLIEAICQDAERLFRTLSMQVYARLDGIIDAHGQAYFNDPNTTSGMLPSSFFFHQAAEVGLSPKDLLTQLIRRSVVSRAADMPGSSQVAALQANRLMNESHSVRATANSTRVAVVFGGYSSERHISVESGRNIFEKLNSAEGYTPMPHFLLHNSYLSDTVKAELAIPSDPPYSIWQLPVNLLLKDNADDIAKSIAVFTENPDPHAVVRRIHQQVSGFAADLQAAGSEPHYVSLETLTKQYDFAFLSLHGRPGEDGDLQARLEQLGLPFNGSSSASAQLSMDKYVTNEKLKAAGLRVPDHLRVQRTDWATDSDQVLDTLEQRFGYPLIGKPIDDGCSSAVRKIDGREELRAFCDSIFRATPEVTADLRERLSIDPKEEFPQKSELLFEALIRPNGAERFLEVTVGFQTHTTNGQRTYRVLTPSEALAQGGILSLEEKFLAGQGQNITPARFAAVADRQQSIDQIVRTKIQRAAEAVGASGYGRIDAFVRVFDDKAPEVVFIEVNSLPGMTPATCIFHQAALDGMTPAQFIQAIIQEGRRHAAGEA